MSGHTQMRPRTEGGLRARKHEKPGDGVARARGLPTNSRQVHVNVATAARDVVLDGLLRHDMTDCWLCAV